MARNALLFLVLAFLGPFAALEPAGSADALAARFKDPPIHYRSRPLYWLNAPLDPSELRGQIRAMRDECGFGGFAPLTLHSARPEYLTEGYFERYGVMLEMAEETGLKVIFYDDINFPTGTAGGRLAERYPGSMLKIQPEIQGDTRLGSGPPVSGTVV